MIAAIVSINWSNVLEIALGLLAGILALPVVAIVAVVVAVLALFVVLGAIELLLKIVDGVFGL